MPPSSTHLADPQTTATWSSLNPNYLAPEDVYYHGSSTEATLNARKRKERTRSASRRRKGHYKKLLWFKQPFPDNYTDEKTFLDHLQRNPRMQPYEFWSLMANSTVIVQQVASVAIFCCSFTAIFQERVSPLSVVSGASFCTFLAWLLWDYWMADSDAVAQEDVDGTSSSESLTDPQEDDAKNGKLTFASNSDNPAHQPPYIDPNSSLSPKNQQRLATAKSALLIYAALLGLSPILKSLTKSTTSDSIWALSSWLLFMNIAFFDYGTSNGSQYVYKSSLITANHNSLPASISTNSALMASTVLASRLPSTTHVFSLTLFSIEIFGLFPIFRRQLRAESWYGHLALTIFLVVTASGALFATLAGGTRGVWIAGVILGSLITFVCMGICSWWLISLQKYKNEIHGPWDPARPVIRRRWD
ncbi:GPI2-domain-containing protein [Massarina eburnea CBS 473.64]|uniref:GPI2-domain-containing protein n=1 Tax=Massarina eburnea CBS 473.64 TaxID=1395130 RepID=A0A6A6S9P6_9PLEO|nr:GPI2-domain-containing protein [Massarina eburnea CBS 473.64]